MRRPYRRRTSLQRTQWSLHLGYSRSQQLKSQPLRISCISGLHISGTPRIIYRKYLRLVDQLSFSGRVFTKFELRQIQPIIFITKSSTKFHPRPVILLTVSLNWLNPDIRLAPTLSLFKAILSNYYNHDPKGKASLPVTSSTQQTFP